jgi:signal transduction histidine kinase
VESQETERKQLSRELHDEVGQILTALKVQLGQIEPDDPDSMVHLQRATELTERSLRSVRQMARGLRPAMLDDLGLAPALKWLGRDFSQHSGLDIDVQIDGELRDLDEPHRTCLYRVTQEALTNCARHSGCNQARVLLRETENALELTVQDDGTGFAAGDTEGVGVLGMRERVEELDGDFAVISSPGAGTLVRANLPKTLPRESHTEKHDSNIAR